MGTRFCIARGGTPGGRVFFISCWCSHQALLLSVFLCIGETPPRKKIEHGQETMQEQGFVWRVARWINETSHRVLLRDGWCDVRNEIHQSLVLFK